MKRLLIRLGLSVLGTVITLLWWTYHGTGSHAQQVSHIPTKVLQGGNQLEISTEASTASTMRISFDDVRKPVGEQIVMESWEKIPAGSRTFVVDVPSGVGGYIELEADHPNPGDILTVKVKFNGQDIEHETDKLDRPLEPNTAFFVQFHHDDYSKAAADVVNVSPESDPSE
jgi:hypothetical protein